MQEPTLLEQLAANWMLVAMVTLYVGAILWAFRPGTRDTHKDIADIPLRNDSLQEREAE
jgi:cytochrome c oxidase cbb3-type subunit 4